MGQLKTNLELNLAGHLSLIRHTGFSNRWLEKQKNMDVKFKAPKS